MVYFSTCCIGIDPEDGEFKSEFLPALAETIVDILAKIYTKFTKTSNVRAPCFKASSSVVLH